MSPRRIDPSSSIVSLGDVVARQLLQAEADSHAQRAAEDGLASARSMPTASSEQHAQREQQRADEALRDDPEPSLSMTRRRASALPRKVEYRKRAGEDQDDDDDAPFRISRTANVLAADVDCVASSRRAARQHAAEAGSRTRPNREIEINARRWASRRSAEQLAQRHKQAAESTRAPVSGKAAIEMKNGGRQ